jgi:hypothetical protein
MKHLFLEIHYLCVRIATWYDWGEDTGWELAECVAQMAVTEFRQAW